MTFPLFVTPSGRAMPHLRQASLYALWESRALVSLRAPLVIADRRGR